MSKSNVPTDEDIAYEAAVFAGRVTGHSADEWKDEALTVLHGGCNVGPSVLWERIVAAYVAGARREARR